MAISGTIPGYIVRDALKTWSIMDDIAPYRPRYPPIEGHHWKQMILHTQTGE